MRDRDDTANLDHRVTCLDDDTVDRLVRGELAAAVLAAVDEHLDTCGDCRAVVSVLARASGEPPDGPILPRGTVIRRYVLGDVVGGGAMGVVYAAWDPELDRRVALKVLRDVDGDPARARGRVLREAQAMARLAHPNVVTVHEAGTVDDHVFVAMELVTGRTLRAWARDAPDAPAVCDVMLQVGRGLAAAHAAGLVHRDVKPENVIVGDDGRVRIGDFGLALGGAADGESGAITELLRTRTGAVAGTPAYMAPEVLRGEPADARSDQFSYAVTFFEVLHGARPFGGTTWRELLDAVDAGRVVTGGRSVPGWIDAIVRRGLSARPDDRWPSIDAMVDALADALAARRERRVRRWAGVAAAALIASGGIAVVVAARGRHLDATQVVACDTGPTRIAEIWNDNARARVRASLAAVRTPYAGTAAERVVGALDAWTARWADADGAVCRATFVEHRQPPDAHAVRARCLGRRRDELAALIERLGAADREIALRAVDAAEGMPAPQECVALAPDAADPPPADPGARAEIDAVARGIAGVDAATALGDWRRAVADSAPLVVRAEATGHAPTSAEAHRSRAAALRAGDRAADAEEEALASLWAAERGHDALGEAHAWLDLVGIAGERRDLDTAEDRMRHAIEAIARAGDPPALVAGLETARGLVAYNRGRFDEAAGLLGSALARWRAIAGDDSAEVARTRSSLGSVARAQGRLDEARTEHEAALAIDRRRLGDRHPAVARDLHNLAGVLRLGDDLDGALARYREALAIEREALGDDHASTGLTRNSIGLVLMAQGKLDEAQAELEQARTILERAGNGERALALHNLGLIAQARGRHREALRWFDDADAVYRDTVGADADGPRRLREDRRRSAPSSAPPRRATSPARSDAADTGTRVEPPEEMPANRGAYGAGQAWP